MGLHLLASIARFPYAQLFTVALYHLIADKECYLCADIAYCVEKAAGKISVN